MNIPKEKTACFTGHRVIDPSLQDTVLTNTKRVIAALYKKGYRCFIAGGAIGFDTIAANAVLSARDYYGDIRLELYLPCKGQDAKWSNEQKEEYQRILSLCDEYKFISEVYTPGCMHERNRAMVEASSACVAYIKQDRGGSAYTVDFARKNGLACFNVALMEE